MEPPVVKIWVDADAMPRAVKEIVFRAAGRRSIETILVANQRIGTPRENPLVRAVRVPGGLDEADDYIVEKALEGDLAITADIPLAARLVERGVSAIDPRGTEYTEDNISERLSVRDFADELRSSGVETGGPKSFSERDRQAFNNALDRTLTRLLKRKA